MPWAKNMTANLDLCIYFYIHICIYFFRYSQSIFKYQWLWALRVQMKGCMLRQRKRDWFTLRSSHKLKKVLQLMVSPSWLWAKFETPVSKTLGDYEKQKWWTMGSATRDSLGIEIPTVCREELEKLAGLLERNICRNVMDGRDQNARVSRGFWI